MRSEGQEQAREKGIRLKRKDEGSGFRDILEKEKT